METSSPGWRGDHGFAAVLPLTLGYSMERLRRTTAVRVPNSIELSSVAAMMESLELT